jgi:hypothetical protein
MQVADLQIKQGSEASVVDLAPGTPDPIAGWQTDAPARKGVMPDLSENLDDEETTTTLTAKRTNMSDGARASPGAGDGGLRACTHKPIAKC